MNLLADLQERLRAALAGLCDDPASYLGMVKPTQDPRHGDYQANCAMPLAKALKKAPRDVAQEIVRRLPLDDLLETPEIAGPGFINLRLRKEALAGLLQAIARDDRLGVRPLSPSRTLVIDYSSPNVAKPMHVGHLRSTIIGDALARLFRFLGCRVIADNHLGDWGTQFGILLYGYKHFRDEEALRKNPVRELTRLYVHVRGLMEASRERPVEAGDDDDGEGFGNPIADAARLETVRLHQGDPENVRLWQMFMPWCMQEIERVYRRLDVHFDAVHGESYYQAMLPEVVADLEQRGIAQRSAGAVVVFFGDDEPPAMIQKRDGAYTYTATDLATIRFRMKTWRPDAMLYVVDYRQSLHFKQLFAIARRWGCAEASLEHISFGSVLGADRRPIKTREGGAVELEALLDEAVERAAAVYEQSRADRLTRGEEVPDLDAEERRRLAEVVGIGAVKYADLCQNRTTDYVFNWDKMLAMDGNTACYMQYAYARIRSIFRKGLAGPAGSVSDRCDDRAPGLETDFERSLALSLLRLPESLMAAAADYRPNLITAYLWDLAKTYSGFYQNCPVLRAETTQLRDDRLLLCSLTARTIQQALNLLGIHTVERM